MFSNTEIEMIRVITEEIFPGSNEARAYEFIQRDAAANPFMIGLYREGLRAFENQARLLFGKTLLDLDQERLIELLKSQEHTPFFQFIRNHTMEGVFSDPIYGGNYQAYGWRLIGFEGPRFYTAEEINKKRQLPKVYYSLKGIAHEDKTGI
ncbi:gluconate 2-dehydrogenase subunit 3 family protein [Ferviditalea candida]|uniref:Gluconate 2-dehydrogenase subunit 3 family protein n=1 Tax=Ferviditalea candida TaxID=3108399 RepID=A0ABU5ZJ64_9BACL|nr:gluconate 2-dehydrogenase subunit 3 family protein [Paenibacillaceae bacterium T2]